MRIAQIRVRGFRCFGTDGETVELDGLTAFVGPNASGKTALMMALARLFGQTRGWRSVTPSDFHLRPGERLTDEAERSLEVECRLEFPELAEERDSVGAAVAEAFNQMIVEEPDGDPYCRVRLEATWLDDGTPEGDVEQRIWWILTESDDPDVIDKNKRAMSRADRARIRLVYIPAARDPSQQVRATTATTFGRLLDAVDLSAASGSIGEALDELRDAVDGVQGVRTIADRVQRSWSTLYDGRAAGEVSFTGVDEDPAELLKSLLPVFGRSDDGHELSVSQLSDGHRSMFSIALSLGLFEVEEGIRAEAQREGFVDEAAESLPILTVFALEEPENHLSPQYLGKVVARLGEVAAHENAQVALSSHSPSLLGRIDPANVRYFLGHEHAKATSVREIPLPSDDSEESFKYVRQAVRAHPELYFARLVILGEGPSEQVLLERAFDAAGWPLDVHFIAVAPLGGRHVNHFWRLLDGLSIPHLTLLDLDRERAAGGWERIQYVRDQLVRLHGEGHEDLESTVGEGDRFERLDSEEYDTLADRPATDVEEMEDWIEMLKEQYGVYFSAPLDIDLCFLEAFTDAYTSLAPANGGPRIPADDDPDLQEFLTNRTRQVLGSAFDEDETGHTDGDLRQLSPWYKYLFIDNSKPETHARALLSLSDEDLSAEAPSQILELVAMVRSMLPASGGSPPP